MTLHTPLSNENFEHVSREALISPENSEHTETLPKIIIAFQQQIQRCEEILENQSTPEQRGEVLLDFPQEYYNAVALIDLYSESPESRKQILTKMKDINARF